MIRVSNFKTSFYVIIFLFLLFPVKYKFIPLGIPTSFFSILIFLLFLLFALKKYSPIAPSSYFFSILLVFISAISYLLNINADTHILRITLTYLIIIISLPALLSAMAKEKNHLFILEVISIASFINALFIIGMFMSSTIKYSYLSLLLDDGHYSLDGLMSLRMIGINGLSVYTAGFIQMSCAMLYVVYIKESSKSQKVSIKNIIFLGAIILSAIIAARSSIIGCIFLFILISYTFNLKGILKLTTISLLFLVSILLFLIAALPVEYKDFFIGWVTEIFTSGSNTKSLQTNIGMYIYTFNDFSLIGESRWFGDNSVYYMNTDVGWYRLTFAFGYIGIIIWLSLLFSLINWRRVFIHKISPIDLFSLLFLSYVLVMMFKGAILVDSYQAILFLIISYYISKHRQITK